MCNLKIKCISVESLGSTSTVTVQMVSTEHAGISRISVTYFSSHMLRNSILTVDPKPQLTMESF